MELSNAYFNNCTIADNVASSFGGFADIVTVRLKIANTNLENNDAPMGRDLFVEKFLSTQSELLTLPGVVHTRKSDHTVLSQTLQDTSPEQESYLP